jgi:hypothetical protein
MAMTPTRASAASISQLCRSLGVKFDFFLIVFSPNVFYWIYLIERLCIIGGEFVKKL